MKTHSPRGVPYLQPAPVQYAVRRTADAVEIVQLERGESPKYVNSVRHGLIREPRYPTVQAAFAAAKHFAGWNRRGCDGLDKVTNAAP